MGYVKYVVSHRQPSLAQLVERGTVVKLPSHGLRFNSGTGDVIFMFFCIFIGKFAQRSNLTKTKMIYEPR